LADCTLWRRSLTVLFLSRGTTYWGAKSCSTSTPRVDLGRSRTWPMLASTLKLRPRYFLMVLALAGDSTITRLVLPLVTGPFLLAADEAFERAEVAEEARERAPLALLAPVALVALLLVDLPVVFL